MQLQIDLPETLALQFLPHLDQSPKIIEAGLQQVSQQDAPTAFQTDFPPNPHPNLVRDNWPIDARSPNANCLNQEPGNFLDFLGDLEQRRRLIRQALNDASETA